MQASTRFTLLALLSATLVALVLVTIAQESGMAPPMITACPSSASPGAIVNGHAVDPGDAPFLDIEAVVDGEEIPVSMVRNGEEWEFEFTVPPDAAGKEIHLTPVASDGRRGLSVTVLVQP
jgi:hypothetical protein